MKPDVYQFCFICSDLKNNGITEIHPDAFVPLKSLTDLYVLDMSFHFSIGII